MISGLEPNLHFKAFWERLTDLRILVIGDVMLDRYLTGLIDRISPEAPVPIVDIEAEEDRPGGAANVALNLRALGMQVLLAGTVGQDAEGALLQDILDQAGIPTEFIQETAARPTTLKTRVLGHNNSGQQRQILRIDREVRSPLAHDEEELLLSTLSESLPPVDGIIIEDYDKGVVSRAMIQWVEKYCRTHQVPWFVDPKFNHFFDYRQCDYLKPNLKEINQALGTHLTLDQLADIKQAVVELRHKLDCRHILLTLGDRGLLLHDADETIHVPAIRRHIADVSGAGDTVISVFAGCVVAGLDHTTSAQVANLAGGLVCEREGVYALSRKDLDVELPRHFEELKMKPL